MTRARGKPGPPRIQVRTEGSPQHRRDALTAALRPEVTTVLALFRVVFRSVRRHNRYIEGRCGIGAMELRALAVVNARPHIAITALADALLIHQPTASKLAESLVRQGLIHRQRSARDGRIAELEITRRGAVLIAKAPKPAVGILPDGLGSLDPLALRRLEGSLTKLLEAMKRRDYGARYTPLSDP